MPTGATAVTQAVDTGGILIATTGYVVGQGYLKSATASSTYLTSATASSTYLTSATASSTYLASATAASTYAPLASPALTGTPSLPTGATAVTQAVDTGGDLIATTGYVVGQGYLKSATAASTYLTSATASSTYLTSATASSTYLASATAASTYAPLASPALTGTPTAPTPTAGDNDTSIATTAFVHTAVAGVVAVNSLGTQVFAGPGNIFTGIPSWAKSITMAVGNMDGSLTSSDARVRIGTSAGFVSTGYISAGTAVTATPATVNDTTGFIINIGGTVGSGIIRLYIVSGGSWICEHTIGSTTKTCVGGGVVNLPGGLALDRIQILPVAGTFAASGAVDVFYQ